MTKMIDLTGKTFGRLTVLKEGDKPKTTNRKEKFWLCKCICGNQAVVAGYQLRSGITKSCGCYSREQTGLRAKGNSYKKTHGMSSSRIYKIFYAMYDRCYNPNKWNYDKYGGR